MSYYMDGFGEGTTDKVSVLVEKLGAEILQKPEFYDLLSGYGTICVFHNESFDAVGVCDTRVGFNYFNNERDKRRKTWLKLSTEKIRQYSGLGRE